MNSKKKIAIVLILLGVVLLGSGIFLSFNQGNDNEKDNENGGTSTSDKWVLNGLTVTNGDLSFEIGDYYEYDESNGGAITGLTDVKWKVMGVDENGNLLILSASDVGSLTLGKADDLVTSQNDYIEGASRLDDLAKEYGNGRGALAARSVTLDDINKITGFDPNVDADYYNYATSYYWTSVDKPKYESTEFGTGIMNLAHNGVFVWYDVNSNTWQSSTKTGTETDEDPVLIVSLLNTLCTYKNRTYNDDDGTFSYLFEEDSLVFKMLYLDEEGNRSNYWTADSFVNATNVLSAYGYNIVKYDEVNYTYLVYSPGVTRETTAGVRVVVTID